MTRILAALRALLIALAVGLGLVIVGALVVVLSPVLTLVWLLTPASQAHQMAALFERFTQSRERPQA